MANKRYLKDTRKKMRRASKGSFTTFCGGRITGKCIERGLNSNDPDVKAAAQRAKRVMQPGGYTDPNAAQQQQIAPMQPQPMQPMQPAGIQPMQPKPVAPLANPTAPKPELQTGPPSAGPGADAAGAAAGGGGGGGGIDAAAKVAQMAGEEIAANSEQRGGKTAGKALAGAGKGAAMGATIGSIIPGVGTAIGAAVGAGVGAIAGGMKQRKANQEATAQIAQQREANLNEAKMNAQSKYGSFARYYSGGMRYMQDGGTKNLPGGVQMPIGYGVDKFIGNKHDQAGGGSPSGIILEEGGKSKPGIEVEDGELHTDVKTTDGKKDYIVSDHIVNPATGNTLAEDMEREIKKAKSKKEANQIKQKYVKLNEELKDDGKPEVVKAQEGEFTGGALTDEEAGVGEQSSSGGGMFGEATSDSLEAMKARNPWYDFEAEGFDPNNQESVLKFQREYNKRAPEGKKITEDGKYGTQTDSVKLNPGIPQIESKPIQQLEVPGAGEPRGLMLPPEQKKEETPEPVAEEAPVEEQDTTGKVRLRPTGTMLQALGPAMALTKDLSPQKVAPKYIQAPRLGRVNLDRERAEERGAAAATKSATAASLSGPAAAAVRASTDAQSANRQRGISESEGRQNVQISNREKGMEMDASKFNANAYMAANRTNVAAANRAQELNQARDIGAYNQLGKIGTQTVKDRNQQRADIFEGQASQVDGEFDRALANYYPSSRLPFTPKVKINTAGGTTYSQDQIDAMYAQQTQADETTNAKRGGYIRKKGKVRRNRRKKK